MAEQETVGSDGRIEVYYKGGLVHHDYIGDQTGETIQAMVKANDRLVEELQAKGERILVLADFSKVGKHNQGAREALRAYLGTRFFERIAAFGLPAGLEVVGRILLSITGKAGQVQICDTEAQARNWLNQP